MKISVLMSVYINTNIGDLNRCLRSIFLQTRSPAEIVVVLDGPVSETVQNRLSSLNDTCNVQINILKFSNNRGLGAALADGLNACQYELIARVDSDDVSIPERFEMQYQCFMDFPGLSVVGGALEEIYERSDRQFSLIRTMPLSMDEIKRFANYRNPVNHPTIMFRRQDILAAGNYQTMLWFEDYYLWARLIIQGFKFKNIEKVLVQAWADDAYFRRRGGWVYFKHELKLSIRFKQIGFHNGIQMIRFIVSRIFFRIAPVEVRTWLYSRLLRTSQNEFLRS